MVEAETKVQRYEKYKDSGVEWLGDEIPEHWEALANKFIFNLKKNQVGKKSADYDLLSLTLKGIVVRNLENGGKFPAEFDTYQEVKKGDFVFCLFDVEETPRCVGLSDYNGMITGAYTVMEPNENFDRRFLYYFYLNLDADKRMKPLYTGLRNTISKDSFFAFKTFVPPLSEQTAIAQFLDDKTAKIDQAIAIKEQQINLLKERKQILIHKAVTRGLDDSVRLKDSGVEWIGEIPEHWEVKRFKFLCDITTGSKNTQDKVKNGLYPFYVRSQTPEKINTYTFDGEAILTAGDGAGVGKVFHYLNEKFDFHQRVYKFSNFRNIEGKLLFYYLRSSFHNVALNGEAKSTVDSLRLPLIQNFMVTIPSKKEQREIIFRIETASQKIETAISLKQQEIDKLKEYKSSLINEVVTGKVKVNSKIRKHE